MEAVSVLEVVLGAAAAVGLGMAARFVWSVVKAVRRTGRRARRAVEPARVRSLSVRAALSSRASGRRDLARDVLQARQAFELARRDGRPVRDLGPAVDALERVARSLEVDQRMGRAVDDEVDRVRQAARSLIAACQITPGRAGLLDDVADAAERARLVAQAHRELSGGSPGAPPARRGTRWSRPGSGRTARR